MSTRKCSFDILKRHLGKGNQVSNLSAFQGCTFGRNLSSEQFNRAKAQTTEFPVIDISPFNSSYKLEKCSSSQLKARKKEEAVKFHNACRDVGFFYVAGHGIESSMLDDSLAYARRFFELPESRKSKLSLQNSLDLSRGYQKVGENVTGGSSDYHEAFDVMKEEKNPSRLKTMLHHGGRNLWPDEKECSRFRSFFEKEYIPAMLNLGESMMKCFALSLDIEESSLISLYNESFFVFRAIHYPGGDPEKNPQGCGEHTDYGCFTFLHSDPVPGALEVQTRDGYFIQPQHKEGLILCNIGDMIELWSAGYYQSTIHRVRTTTQSRVSVPFFFEANYDAYIEPLVSSKFVEPDNPYNKSSTFYGEHLYRKTSSNFSFNSI
eukprot:CAMPEP_0184010408 /NCGR_PEP_ID=MMETSP0954-20121128/3193_1 /TAXON_ID=627963 /ORGANISM="Aplanochytrium sp, Strain PBS07" /LENGTH=376 /DNA_ID=CAMNT_0026289987 /DNA_START=38 /DNA_END=1168 /DNA_ORIENTATION=-